MAPRPHRSSPAPIGRSHATRERPAPCRRDRHQPLDVAAQDLGLVLVAQRDGFHPLNGGLVSDERPTTSQMGKSGSTALWKRSQMPLTSYAQQQQPQSPDMTFFVTSTGPGKGADLGGLE